MKGLILIMTGLWLMLFGLVPVGVAFIFWGFMSLRRGVRE